MDEDVPNPFDAIPNTPQQVEVYEDWELEDVEGVIERLLDYATHAAQEGQDIEVIGHSYDACYCYANEAQHTLLPCRHSPVCFGCAVAYLKQCSKNLESGEGPSTPSCPMCRTPTVDMVPLN